MRINIIKPSALMDQHLLAEIREMKMLPKAFLKSYNSYNGIQFNRIKPTYTLNTGHGYFFYNKFLYIKNRFNELIIEAKSRGFKAENDILDLSKIPFSFMNDYVPTMEEKFVNLERIKLRISEKPDFYRYKSTKICYKEFYDKTEI